MTTALRPRERVRPAPGVAARRPRTDVLFVAATALLVAIHLTIFFAVLVTAPVTLSEQRALALVQLPVDVARTLVLPFHALLLGCLYVLGARTAGRWAGFGSMLAVLALDLAAEPAAPVYGPPTALGGWVAASLLALALVLLPRHRLAAAAVLGAASGCAAVLLLALPAFLGAVALRPAARPHVRLQRLGCFAGVFALAAAALQLVWLARLGTAGWLARAGEYVAELQPHPLVPLLEQQRLLFAAWHFPAVATFSMASFLFVAAGVGVVRYLREPLPGERGPRLLVVLRRFPVELAAAGLVLAVVGVRWALSGETVVVEPNLPVIAAIAPLLTALAYRGAKWLLTVNRFWALAAVVYLVCLMLARSTQLVLTLVQAFR